MPVPLQILIIEDSDNDAQLILTEVQRGGYEIEVTHVESTQAAEAALTRRDWDLIICDNGLSDFDPIRALKMLKTSGKDPPFILISKSPAVDEAVRALREGAHDFIHRSQLARLLPAIQRELKHAEARRESLRVEAALREAETRYRRLVEGMPAVTYTLSSVEPYPTLYISPQVKHLLGFTQEEWQKDPFLWQRQIHPEDRDRVIAEDRASRAQGRPFISEYRIFARDGRTVWLHDETHHFHEPGIPAFSQGIEFDITDRKIAEQALQESEEHFRSLYENATIGIYRTTPQGKILLANPALVRMLGYSSLEELAQRNLEQEGYEPGYERSEYRRQIESQGEVRGLVSSWTKKDGSAIFVRESATTVRGSDNEVLYYDGTVEDITDRKLAEQALQTSEERYRTLFESNPHPMWVYDTQTLSFLAVNEAATKAYGYSRDEFLNMTIKDIRPPEEIPALMDNVQSTTEPLQRSGPWKHRTKDGTVIDVEVISHQLILDGHSARLVLANDISERIRMETVQGSLLEIANATITLGSLDELYATIHKALQRAIPAENFYIALYDLATRLLSFPYFVDEKEEQPEPYPLGHSLTEYVLRTGKPLLGRPEFYAKLVSDGEVDPLGPESIDWLGVPLKVKDTTIGVMAVQSYKAGMRYSEADLDVLSFVSSQVALSIQRKQVEESLRESEERFHLVVDAAPGAIVVVDANGKIKLVNAGVPYMLGYTGEDLVGQPVEILVPQRMRGEHVGHRIGFMASPMRRDIPGRVELLALHKDGREIPVEIGLTPFQSPDGPSVLALIVDITERKRAEQALREAENRYRTLVEQLPMITYINATEGLGRNSYVSPQVEAILGYTAKEWVDNPTFWLKIVHPEDHPRVVQAVEHSNQTKDPFDIEYRVQANDGHIVWLRDQAVPVKDLSGQSVYWQGFMSDITDAKRSEELTQQHVQRLGALHTIDLAISSSFDLKMMLNVVLESVTRQLKVDAAGILLLRPESLVLEFAAGQGFWTRTIESSRIYLGDGLAGKAALERQTVSAEDLRGTNEAKKRSFLLSDEKFISYYGVPLVSKGKVRGVLEIFSRSALSGDSEWLQFLDALAGQAAIAIDSASMFQDLQRSNLDLALAYDATIEGWSHALDLRDKETEGHTLRVTELAIKLAQAVGVADEDLVHIRRGGLLHDIGKMGVPDPILLKPGPLNDEEWTIMRQHPQFAFDMLTPISYLRPALDIPHSHHEKWDGSGYPNGLKGEQIPLAARVFAVVDVWDALSSDRPYRKAWSKEDVEKYILEQSGKHFDPKMVKVFMQQLHHP